MRITPLKLIGETDFANYDIFTEKNKMTGELDYRLRGPYLAADFENGNNRTYPYDVLKPEVDRYVTEKVETGRAMGELEHPEYTYVNLERACHKITSLREENKVWIGESTVLRGTPTGDIVSALLGYDATFGMSSRGVGKINEGEDGKSSVVEQYIIICVDTVADPSIGKYVDGILESKDFMVNTHGIIVEAKFDILENNLKRLPINDKTKHIQTTVINFLRSI